MLAIRVEVPDDAAAIHDVNVRVFGREEEAMLVDRLRGDGVVIVSLVATEDGRVVGHILFHELTIETGTGGVLMAASLAPMAVPTGIAGEGNRLGPGARRAGFVRAARPADPMPGWRWN